MAVPIKQANSNTTFVKVKCRITNKGIKGCKFKYNIC